MQQFGRSIPTVKIDAKKDGFREERETLERKWHPDYCACFFHEPGPKKAQFKRKNCSGHGSNSKEDGSSFGPAFREGLIDGFSRAEPPPLCDRHHERE